MKYVPSETTWPLGLYSDNFQTNIHPWFRTCLYFDFKEHTTHWLILAVSHYLKKSMLLSRSNIHMSNFQRAHPTSGPVILSGSDMVSMISATSSEQTSPSTRILFTSLATDTSSSFLLSPAGNQRNIYSFISVYISLQYIQYNTLFSSQHCFESIKAISVQGNVVKQDNKFMGTEILQKYFEITPQHEKKILNLYFGGKNPLPKCYWHWNWNAASPRYLPCLIASFIATSFPPHERQHSQCILGRPQKGNHCIHLFRGPPCLHCCVWWCLETAVWSWLLSHCLRLCCLCQSHCYCFADLRDCLLKYKTRRTTYIRNPSFQSSVLLQCMWLIRVK